MSQQQFRAFRPLGNVLTKNIVTTTASQALGVGSGQLGTMSVRIANIGTDITFLEFGPPNANASATLSMPLLPNSVEVFTLPLDKTQIQVIGIAGGNTVYMTIGEGL